jgi:hypothetical protein
MQNSFIGNERGDAIEMTNKELQELLKLYPDDLSIELLDNHGCSTFDIEVRLEHDSCLDCERTLMIIGLHPLNRTGDRTT